MIEHLLPSQLVHTEFSVPSRGLNRKPPVNANGVLLSSEEIEAKILESRRKAVVPQLSESVPPQRVPSVVNNVAHVVGGEASRREAHYERYLTILGRPSFFTSRGPGDRFRDGSQSLVADSLIQFAEDIADDEYDPKHPILSSGKGLSAELAHIAQFGGMWREAHALDVGIEAALASPEVKAMGMSALQWYDPMHPKLSYSWYKTELDDGTRRVSCVRKRPVVDIEFEGEVIEVVKRSGFGMQYELESGQSDLQILEELPEGYSSDDYERSQQKAQAKRLGREIIESAIRTHRFEGTASGIVFPIEASLFALFRIAR